MALMLIRAFKRDIDGRYLWAEEELFGFSFLNSLCF